MDRTASRRDKLRKLMKREGLPSLLITNFKNVTYLTGFSGDDSYLLFHPKGELILSDSRYSTQLEEECPGLEAYIRPPGKPMTEAVVKTVEACGLSFLGIEGDSMTVSLRNHIAQKAEGVSLVDTSGLVESLRLIKDKEELETLVRAVRVAEKAFLVLKASLRAELTEKQVSDDLEHTMRTLGARGPSFPPIVAVGPRAALPHARPTPQLVGDSELVLVDWGADVEGYKSDLTRVLVRPKISPKLERIYGVVAKAQARAIAAIRPGITCEELDRVARDEITKAGYGKQFGHSLGHGIGLDIHEAPRLAANQKQPLQPGMVVTIEPGIYVPGWGGVRIEDDVLVTRTGHEVLTSVPKDLAEMVIS